LQLLERGLFPCAPVRPSLAVELDQLDLVSTLFMVGAPNVTNWAETLSICLARKGYAFEGQVSIAVVRIAFVISHLALVYIGRIEASIWKSFAILPSYG
jgi:hypothetical protein